MAHLICSVVFSGLLVAAAPAAPPGRTPHHAAGSNSAASTASATAVAPAIVPAGKRSCAGTGKPWSWNGKWLDWNNGKASITYTRKHGLEIASRGGNYKIKIRARTQLRFSHPFDFEPHKEDQFGIVETKLRFTRIRLKADGHAFRPWVSYKLEYDLRHDYVRDLRTTIKKYDWFQIRAGQWKADYNRERITSSSKQEFVDRSLITRNFALDRQAGVELLGRLMPNSRGDSRYFLGLFTGTGRGNGFESGGHPLLLARYQWNFLGRDVPFSSSDIAYHDRPTASIAVAAATNRSRFSRFSSSGGGQLDGFAPGVPGQYTIKQAMGEFALLYRGFSAQSEYHWKQIFDHSRRLTTRLNGAYAQAGYLPHAAVAAIPRQLELAYRYAVVNPRMGEGRDLWQEHTFAVNWFFEGHIDKLTFDISRVSLQEALGPDRYTTRYRVQWDVHF